MQPDLRVRFFVPVYLALNNQFTRVTKQQAEALLPVHNLDPLQNDILDAGNSVSTENVSQDRSDVLS